MFADKKIQILTLLIASFLLVHNAYAKKNTAITDVNPYHFNYNDSKLPNFNAYKPTSEKKKAFFTYVSHFSQIANNQVLNDRNQLIQLHQTYLKNHQLSTKEQHWLTALAKTYQVSHWDMTQENAWKKLLNRVDIVPTSMLLAQAANESAWGTSRFAQQGNNLFGQWCFSAGCGIVPKQRAPGRTYEVQKFPSALASVQAYILNLNTNMHYQSFRDERAQLRVKDKPISGYALAEGLNHYSQRGEAYVADIRYIIAANQLG